ncbi:MAG: hypothetical protein ACOVOD_11915, partial [Rhodoferax sp.]
MGENAGSQSKETSPDGANLASRISMAPALRIVVITADLETPDPEDTHAITQAERSRSLRI